MVVRMWGTSRQLNAYWWTRKITKHYINYIYICKLMIMSLLTWPVRWEQGRVWGNVYLCQRCACRGVCVCIGACIIKNKLSTHSLQWPEFTENGVQGSSQLVCLVLLLVYPVLVLAVDQLYLDYKRQNYNAISSCFFSCCFVRMSVGFKLIVPHVCLLSECKMDDV